MYLNLDKDNRILSVSFEEISNIKVNELPQGDISEYKYIKGKYVHDPLFTPEIIQEPTIEERLQAAEQALLALMG